MRCVSEIMNEFPSSSLHFSSSGPSPVTLYPVHLLYSGPTRQGSKRHPWSDKLHHQVQLSMDDGHNEWIVGSFHSLIDNTQSGFVNLALLLQSDNVLCHSSGEYAKTKNFERKSFFCLMKQKGACKILIFVSPECLFLLLVCRAFGLKWWWWWWMKFEYNDPKVNGVGSWKLTGSMGACKIDWRRFLKR